MNAKQKRLLIAASDLLAGLSTGTLDRAIRFAQDRKGGGYSGTVCVRCERIKDLHGAVEALWPGLVAKAHDLNLERFQEGQKGRDELREKQMREIELKNRPLQEEHRRHQEEQHRKVTGR